MPREWTMPTRSAARPCRVALAERLSAPIRSRGGLGGLSFSRPRSMRAGLGIPGIAHVAFTIWCAVLLITNPGCQRSQLTDGLPAETDCSSCHGATGNAAPPRALHGSERTGDIGVGAPQSHMLGSEIAGPVACNECHPLPTDMLTHPDVNGGRTEVTFGPLATSSGATPEWDRTSATCKNTYCHGATLSGAEKRAHPTWTVVNGSQRRCSSCHGYPPASPHPTGACESCHGDVSGPGSSIKDPKRHVDGVIDVSGTGAGVKRVRGWRFAVHETRERGRSR